MRYVESIFDNSRDKQIYSQSILWSTANKEEDDIDIINIRKIIHTAHLIDLRRIPHFDENRIKKDSGEILFGKSCQTKGCEDFITTLWDVSGHYLLLSGDRDLVDQRKHYSNSFAELSLNPRLIIKALS